MACLLACELPALRAEMLAKSTKIRREWHTPVFFSLPSLLFFFTLPSLLLLLSVLLLFPSVVCYPSFCPYLVSRLLSSFFSSPHMYFLHLCISPVFSPPLFPFTHIFPYLFCANTHYLVLLSPPLFFTLDPVVFASPSLPIRLTGVKRSISTFSSEAWRGDCGLT